MLSKQGCFGSIITHDAGSDCCKKCHDEKSCAQQAYNNGISIQSQIEISDELAAYSSRVDIMTVAKPNARRQPHKSSKLTNRKTRVAPAKSQIALISTLPKKAKAVVGSCFKKALDVRGDLSKGKNPFKNERPIFMCVACEVALKGSFTKDSLKAALLEQMPHWTEKSAQTHAKIAIQVLSVFGLKEDRMHKRYYFERLQCRG